MSGMECVSLFEREYEIERQKCRGVRGIGELELRIGRRIIKLHFFYSVNTLTDSKNK